MKKTIIAGILSLSCIGVAMAQSAPRIEQGYVVDSSNHAVRSSDGNCVRTGTYDPSTAYHPDCTPVEAAPAPVVEAPAPVPAPMPPQRTSTQLTVHFDFDKAVIRPEDAHKIDMLINNLQGDVTIVAGADFIGSEKYNQKLSERRAEAIANYIHSHNSGLNIARVEGLGESQAYEQSSDACEAVLHNEKKLISCIKADRFGKIHIVSQ